MPQRIRELRALIQSSVSTSFTAADNAAWAPGTAYKLAATAWDPSGARHVGIPSEVLQQRLAGRPAHVVGVQEGGPKFSMRAGKGSSDTTAPMMATLLEAFFGGLESPTSKTDLVEAGSTATTINATGHAMKAGMAVLINGEVRRIASVNTDDYDLEMALSGAPSDGDAIVNSHTVYFDQSATQKYLDLLAVGWHAEDQQQFLGCMGPVTLEGLGVGEQPTFSFDLTMAQMQEVSSGDRDQLEPDNAPSGDESPANKALGGFYVGDWGVTTRAAFPGGSFSIDPGLAFEMIEDRNYANGIGGWRLVSCLPTVEFVTLVDQDYGLHADFTAQTEKQALFQFGNSAQNCFAVSIPRWAQTEAPVREAINNLQGLRIKGQAIEPTVADTADNLYSSAISFHWF